jgi:arylsulfatase A-like enzyme
MKIIVIMLDSLRPDYLGCYGNPQVVSPAIDRIASGGMVFRRAYAEYPITIPSRTAFVAGIHTHTCRPWMPLRPDDHHIAEIVRDGGYKTGAVSDTPLSPNSNMDRGFEFFKRFDVGKVAMPKVDDVEVDLSDCWFGPDVTPKEIDFCRWFRTNRPWAIEHLGGDSVTLVTDEGIRFIRDHRDEDFFLWLDYFEVHEPWDTPEEYTKHYEWDPEGRFCPMPHYGRRTLTDADLSNVLVHYMGSITQADEQVGRIDAALRELDILDDTLIWIISDHGEPFGEHGTIRKYGVPVYDELSRIVWIMRKPGLVPAGTERDSLVCNVDFAPTLLDILDIEKPQRFEGYSIVPLLTEDTDSTRDEVYMGCFQIRRAVFDGEWKFIDNLGEKPDELFNLTEDPAEKRNLAEKEPGRVRTCRRKLWQFGAHWSNALAWRDHPTGPPCVDLEEEAKVQ